MEETIMKKNTKAESGVALGFVLAILFLVTVIVFALGARGVQRLSASFNVKQALAAHYAAEAGAARALYHVKSNASDTTRFCGSSFSATLPDQASFTVAPITCTGTTTVLATINSTGRMGSFKKKVNLVVQVSQGWQYPYAFFGINGFTMNGDGHADSYNSVTGRQNTNVANIGTNSANNGAITLRAGTTKIAIHGNLVVGPGGTKGPPTIVISGREHDQGKTVLQAPLSFQAPVDPYGAYDPLGRIDVDDGGAPPPPMIQPTDALGHLIKYGNINLSRSSTNITLDCGNYQVGGIHISNGAQLTVRSTCNQDNPVKIYVYNSFSVSGSAPSTCSGRGGIVNIDCGYRFPANGQAYPSPRLLIYGMPSLTAASFSGDGLFVGVFYAPSADIALDGSGYYHGSMVGKTITVNGSNEDVNRYGNGDGNLTYDEALENAAQAGPAGSVEVESWFSQ